MAEQKTDAASYRISYFGFNGRGHAIRIASILGGIAFEDHFISFEQHGMDKAGGKRRWSGVPELTILDKDGKDVITIGQSNNILRLVGMSQK